MNWAGNPALDGLRLFVSQSPDHGIHSAEFIRLDRTPIAILEFWGVFPEFLFAIGEPSHRADGVGNPLPLTIEHASPSRRGSAPVPLCTPLLDCYGSHSFQAFASLFHNWTAALAMFSIVSFATLA